MAVLNGKEVDIMAIVITNGEYYIQNTKNGKVKKTKDINEATQFYNVNKAMRKILGKPAQCKGYYLFDTEDTYVKKKNNIHRMYENFCMITQKENVRYVGNICFFRRLH